MIFHLGPLGDLQELPIIERDVEPTASSDAPGAEFVSLKGARSRDRIGPHRASWELEWKYLTVDEYDVLDALRRGHMGGPLWVVDPNVPNLANAQIATGGTEERSVRGWSTVSGARRWLRPATRQADVRERGAVEWTKATAQDELATGREREEYRVPTPPDGGPMVVGARMLRSDAPAGVLVQPGVDLWTPAGSRSTSVLAAGRTVTGVWTDVVFRIASTAGFASLAPMWRAGAYSAGFYVAAVRVAWGTELPRPSRGGGSAVVTFPSLTRANPSEGEFSFSATLNEA